ncbi:response regulator [Desulfosudis oleivorans]|uniref:Response regulator receiver protein n=1 Tax=Desulfosudis oleivorans (strain DSM 6200 / JCM 39069 / Hxd3) TaxID=96561 RepID=A8ZS15_DESOH|nr:response regulator [Desulfosudis oleivorans]ABW66033.1 response regulator receiver protein [Desulfosudis oleivorans Hxd3]
MIDKKILVIDDEGAQRDVMERFIPKLGYAVRVADSAETALAVLKEEAFPLVITDLNMPGMDGLELCRRIKQLDAGIIIYALSGYIASFDEAKLDACGFDGYLSKPANARVLHQAIEGAFEKIFRRAREEQE